MMHILQRFFDKVAVGAPDVCWPWQAALSEKGYGRFKAGSRTIHAHRFIMLPLRADELVDHECRNRACCNPHHLRVVSERVNVLENSVGLAATNVAKTHCPAGHTYDQANTRRVDNRRHCRACNRARAAAKRS